MTEKQTPPLAAQDKGNDTDAKRFFFIVDGSSSGPIPDEWDYLGPRGWPDFHQCDDFLDPLADKIKGGFTEGSADEVRSLLGMLRLDETPEELGKLWFDVNKPEVATAFECKRLEVVDAAKALLEDLKGLKPGTEDWRCAFIDLGLFVVEPFVEYIRGLSIILRPGLPSAAPKVEDTPKMKSADRKAYVSFEYAQCQVGKQLKDRAAYDFLKEEGIPTEWDDVGDLTDYELPSFDTWSRQLRRARQSLGEQKNTPRASRPTGRSIVSQREI